MSSLVNVERLADPGEPTRRSKVVKVSVYLSRRSWKRWCEVMPERSFSWFVRSAIDRFLDEIEELPLNQPVPPIMSTVQESVTVQPK